MPTVLIPLNDGKSVKIDAEDLPLVSRYNWRAYKGNKTFYAFTRIDNKLIGMHKVLLSPPDGLFVDHIDHDGLNNTRKNLRVVTVQQNAWNRSKVSYGGKPPTSRFIGVSYAKKSKRWRAAILGKEKRIVIGEFKTELEAARAYDVKARELRGEYAATNFPDWEKEVS